MKIITSKRKPTPLEKGVLLVVLVLLLYAYAAFLSYDTQDKKLMFYALGTLTAILALFKEAGTSYVMQPELQVVLRPADPDCHITQFGSHDTHYFRIRVANNGGRTADEVEVAVENVEVDDGNGFRRDSRYVPMHLVWSYWRMNISHMSIPPGTFRFSDLGFVLSPTTPQFKMDTGIVFPSLENSDGLLFWIDSRFRPNAGTTYLSPGRYRLTIAAFAKNAARTTLTVTIDWSGTWQTTTREMTEKEINFS